MPTPQIAFDNSSIPKTLSQTIYNYLKDAVVTNKLKANQRIIEKDIAQMFGVSTTPVREALLRLGAEGYIFIDSHRKTVVKEISYTELEDIFQVMAELDTIAIKQVVENIQPEHLQELEELTEQMEQSGEANDIEKYLELNTAVHNKIWDILPNKILQRTIEFVHGQLMRYTYSRITAFQEPAVLERSVQDHKKILRALKDKDKRALKSLARNNWRLLLDRMPKKPREKGD
jgi:DNA-binding GntR family transcriptional regulator